MRLTLLSHFIGRGGSTGFLVQLRDFFQSRGHEVSLVVGFDAPDPMADRYQVVPSFRGQSWRARMQEYVRVVDQTRPDAVYTISGQHEFEVLRFLRVPRALHCLCIEQHEYADIPLWYRQLEPYTELRTANTPDLLDRVKGDPRHKIQLACAPYRLSEVFLQAPDFGKLKPDRADGTAEICWLSRLETFQKRAHWLPEIIERCQKAGARLQWHIYGTGPAEPDLRESLANSGLSKSVTFHGWQEPGYLAAHLGRHDLFFLCSRWEGLPTAMVEAMLCGLACVVPNVPAGMTYMVQNGGGWTYEATSPRRCAEALLLAVADRPLLWRKRCEAQKNARLLNSREVIDGQLRDVEALIQSVRFNGNVADLASARPMKLVTFPVLIKRRWLGLKKRLGLKQ